MFVNVQELLVALQFPYLAVYFFRPTSYNPSQCDTLHSHRNSLSTRRGTARTKRRVVLHSDSAYRPTTRRFLLTRSGTAQTLWVYVLRTKIFHIGKEEGGALSFSEGKCDAIVPTASASTTHSTLIPHLEALQAVLIATLEPSPR